MIALPYDHIEGLVSERFLTEHVKLWQGYLAMLRRVDRRLSDPLAGGGSPKLDSPLRLLYEAQSYALNGALLHELYFENLGAEPSNPDPSAALTAAMRRCSDVAGCSMTEQLILAGLVSKSGWAMMSYDFDHGDLRIQSIDSHNDGVSMRNMPLIVLDCWEHAYWGDWGVDREGYLKKALTHLRWNVINRRYDEARQAHNAKLQAYPKP